MKAIDSSAMSITVATRTFQITSQTKILKDGKPATKQPKAEAAPAAEKSEPIKKAEAPASAGTAKPLAAATPEPEVPEGTELVTMTMREALRDAMAEEMRRDPEIGRHN